ncbi:MAG: PDC sensor domain-containing protein [Rhodoferax sp.]
MSLKFFQSRSIKTRVTLFTLVIFVLSIWAISLHIIRTLHGDMQRLLGEQHFQTVSLVADELNNDVQDRLNALDVIAKMLGPVISGDTAKIQEVLENRPLFHRLFSSGGFVTGMDGTEIAAFPVSAGRVGISFLDRDNVATALKEGKSSVGKPMMSKVLNKPVLEMAVPIRDSQGHVMGAVIGSTDLGKPNFLEKIARSSFNKTGTVSVISPRYRMATPRSLMSWGKCSWRLSRRFLQRSGTCIPGCPSKMCLPRCERCNNASCWPQPF